MSFNVDNFKIVPGCDNGYTKDNFLTSFFVNEHESEICSKCNHFTYKNGIATCNLITGITESEKFEDFNSTIMERL